MNLERPLIKIVKMSGITCFWIVGQSSAMNIKFSINFYALAITTLSWWFFLLGIFSI